MSKINFEEILAQKVTNNFYKYQKYREVGAKIFESVFVLPKLCGVAALCGISVRGKLRLEAN